MHIPVTLATESQNETKTVETNSLVDCGAGGVFMDQAFAKAQGFPLKRLLSPIKVYNVDGTPNKKGKIRYSTTIPTTVHGRTRRTRFLITGLGKEKVIFGLPWLRRENPNIDFEKETFDWRKQNSPDPRTERSVSRTTIEEEPSEPFLSTTNILPSGSQAVLEEIETDDDLLISFIRGEEGEVWIQAKTTTSQTLAQESTSEEKKLPLEDMIPPEYHDYKDIFDKKAASRFPASRTWDHAIVLKEGFEPKRGKTYSLSPKELEVTRSFIAENKEKGYIQESTILLRIKEEWRIVPVSGLSLPQRMDSQERLPSATDIGSPRPAKGS